MTMDNYFDNKTFFSLINKWKKHIIVIAVVSAVISGGASYLITPLFKSTAILYPINISEFSDENQTEQMLQVISSNDVKRKLINRLNLYKHYKINIKDKYHETYIFYRLNKNISFNKTKYEALRITVLDKDPQIAKSIADELISLYTEKVQLLHRQKYKEFLDIKKKEMRNKANEIDSLENRINFLREKYSILDYEIQVKELTRSYYSLLDKSPNKAKDVKEILDNLRKYGGEFKKLDKLIIEERENFLELKKKCEELEIEYNKDITYAQIIEAPFPADKKSTPIRWLIVLLSVIGTIGLFIIGISIIESKNLIKN
jgi:uncharacterized protein involved in exopolysaccharide biosynthesis